MAIPHALELGDTLPTTIVTAIAELDPFDPALALAAHTADATAEDPVLLDALGRLLASAQSENTRLAYSSDWRRFTAWCQQRGRGVLPATPLTLAIYLADAARTLDAETGRAAYTAATLTRWVTSIGRAHTATGQPSPSTDPLVRTTMAGIRRAHGTRPTRKRALLLEDLKAMINHLPPAAGPHAAARRRDHALLLFGWAGAFRRSELIALDVGDVSSHEDGLHVHLARSKTDQTGAGLLKALPFGSTPLTCSPCAWRAWREVLDTHDRAGPKAVKRLLEQQPDPAARNHICRAPSRPDPLPPSRPLFRPINRHGTISDRRLSPAGFAGVIKRYAALAGTNPDLIGGHSLRAGFATQAGRNKASVSAIMAQTGHRSPATVYVYLRRAAPLEDNAVTDVGL